MSASIDKLHDRARRAIESGEDKFRHAAEHLADARKLGATQRQSARAIGKSPAWVNALLKWRRDGYKNHCPFPRAKRVQAAEQKTTPERTQVQIARADAERAKAEFQRARAEATARMFGPQIKQIPDRARRELLKALCMLGSEHAAERASAALIVETQRARLNLTWDELLIPAEARSELSEAA